MGELQHAFEREGQNEDGKAHRASRFGALNQPGSCRSMERPKASKTNKCEVIQDGVKPGAERIEMNQKEAGSMRFREMETGLHALDSGRRAFLSGDVRVRRVHRLTRYF